MDNPAFEEVIDLGFHIDGYGSIIFKRSKNELLTEILDKEVQRENLQGKKIFLVSPEKIEDVYKINKFFGMGNFSVGYVIVDASVGPTDYFTDRKNIRHELAHIKFGDHDRGGLPLLLKIYYLIIEEPRAMFYAKFG